MNPSYVTVYRSVAGLQTVLLVWNDDGFYEPWQTGFGPYDTLAEAEQEAKIWAENEGCEYLPGEKCDS